MNKQSPGKFAEKFHVLKIFYFCEFPVINYISDTGLPHKQQNIFQTNIYYLQKFTEEKKIFS